MGVGKVPGRGGDITLAGVGVNLLSYKQREPLNEAG